jgi:hypothetical protein
MTKESTVETLMLGKQHTLQAHVRVLEHPEQRTSDAVTYAIKLTKNSRKYFNRA